MNSGSSSALSMMSGINNGMNPNMFGMNNNNMNSNKNFNGWDLSELQNMNSFFEKYQLKDKTG